MTTGTNDVPSLRDVLDVLEHRFPPSDAAPWDRVGLVTGDPEQPVSSILFAVDPTLAVVEEARDSGADLLITHHPLLLRGVHSVATTTAKGATVTALVVADIALWVAHTNADVATPGVNTALADAFGLRDTRPLVVDEGLGLVGELEESMSLRDFAARVAARLPATAGGVRVAGPAEAPVTRVALLGGAGDSAFDAVRASGADVYVTSDLRHHPALEAREEARGGPPYLVDVAHSAAESLWLARAARDLRDELAARGASVDTHVSTLRTDPWDFCLGGDATGEAERPASGAWTPGTWETQVGADADRKGTP